MPVVSPAVEVSVSESLALGLHSGCLRAALLLILAEGPADLAELGVRVVHAGCDHADTPSIADHLWAMEADGLVSTDTDGPPDQDDSAWSYCLTQTGLDALQAGLTGMRHRHHLLTAMLAHYQRVTAVAASGNATTATAR